MPLEESPTIRTVSAEAGDPAEARRWLDQLDLAQSEGELYIQVRQELSTLTRDLKRWTLPSWWRDPDVEVRLVAALFYIRWHTNWGEHGVPDRAELRAFCGEVLTHGPHERARQVAALGLVALHENAYRPTDSERSPEVALLDQALTDPDARLPALRALLAVVNDSFPARKISLWQITNLSGLTASAEIAPRDWATACLLAFAGGRLSRSAEVGERTRQYFQRDGLNSEEIVTLSALAHRLGEEFLASLLSDTDITVEYLLRLVDYLDSQKWQSLYSWHTWRRFLTDRQVSPLLRLRFFSAICRPAHCHWNCIPEIASEPDLPFDAQCALFDLLWRFPNAFEEAGHQDALMVLMKLPNEARVALTVFPDGKAPQFIGHCPPGTVRQILNRVRDPRSEYPLAYRVLLARCLPVNGTASFDDRRVLVEAEVQYLSETREEPPAWAWQRLTAHVGSSLDLARKLLADDRIATERRLALVNTILPHQDVLAFAGRNPTTASLKARVLDSLGKEFWENHEFVSFRNEINASDDLWNRLITMPEMQSCDPRDLVAVATDDRQPEILRLTAASWLRTWLRSDPAQRDSCVAQLLGALNDPTLPARIWNHVLEELVVCASDPARSSQVVAGLAAVFANPAIPFSIRERIFLFLPISSLSTHAAAFWSAVDASGDPDARARLLSILLQRRVLPPLPTIRSVLDQLMATDRAPDAPEAWSTIAPVGDALTADALQLLQIAARETSPACLRDVAIFRFERLPLNEADRRALWSRFADRAWSEAWNDCDLRHAVLQHLVSPIRHLELQTAGKVGPSGPLWPALSAVALLPDQALSAEALAKLVAPVDSARFVAWCHETLPSVPEAVYLAFPALLGREIGESRTPCRAAALIERAFAHLRSERQVRAALVDTLIRAAICPPRIRRRVLQVLEACACHAENGSEDSAALGDLIRSTLLEAQLLARDTDSPGDAWYDEPDLPPGDRAPLVALASATPVPDATRLLQDAVFQRLKSRLPGVTTEQFQSVLRKTPAPAILAGHYLRAHPEGLSLFAQAITAASGDERAWDEWRFERPEARWQLKFLSDRSRAQWRQNLSVAADLNVVPGEVAAIASFLRERFARALREQEVPDVYARLIPSEHASPESVVAAITCYATLAESIGKRIGRTDDVLSEHLLEKIDPQSAAEIRTAFAGGERQALLNVRHRLARTIDLLRLLQCDERALARNEFRARGERFVPRDGERGEGAVAHIKNLGRAFQSPTREARHHGIARQLDAAFDDAVNAVRQIRTFVSGKPFLVGECSDFKTLIEIGNRPYAQGSCQNYVAKTHYNRALLAYIVDAMTKAIVVRTLPTPDNPEGTPVARAIVRVGTNRDDQSPVIVLEKTYASAGDEALYTPVIRSATREFAKRRGWRLAVPKSHSGTEPAEPASVIDIPASQNGIQYEDGADAAVSYMHGGFASGAYALTVAYE